MKQGTVSWFFGCHHFVIHSIMVIRAWKILYGSWPKLWQIVCIFLHDIGHIGLQYLDDFEQKKKHWELGANIARFLFGKDGYAFVAGHCSYSGHRKSQLYKADKYSWYIAPTWWLWINNVVEPKLAINCEGNMDAIKKFRAAVTQSVESGEFTSTHDMYLKRQNGN